MRAVIQRVSSASVRVEGKVVGVIERPGLVVLLEAVDRRFDLYRIETTSAADRPRVQAPPRPLATRKARAWGSGSPPRSLVAGRSNRCNAANANGASTSKP